MKFLCIVCHLTISIVKFLIEVWMRGGDIEFIDIGSILFLDQLYENVHFFVGEFYCALTIYYNCTPKMGHSETLLTFNTV